MSTCFVVAGVEQHLICDEQQRPSQTIICRRGELHEPPFFRYSMSQGLV
jgi:hypothetical protein